MTTYAIGDVQGCSTQLSQLLDRINFDPTADRLWFVGDLVNRGSNSLKVLRYIKQLGPAAQIVLGNHDLFLLAVAEDIATLRPKDTIQDVLGAEDRAGLMEWLRCRPRTSEKQEVEPGLADAFSQSRAEHTAPQNPE